jgi:hypothetical protein
MSTDRHQHTMITDLLFEYRGYTVNLYETQRGATPIYGIVSIVRPDETHVRGKQHRIGFGVPIGSHRFTGAYAQRIIDHDLDPPAAPTQLALFDT